MSDAPRHALKINNAIVYRWPRVFIPVLWRLFYCSCSLVIMVCFMVTLINVSCVSFNGMVHGYASDKTYRITTVEALLSIIIWLHVKKFYNHGIILPLYLSKLKMLKTLAVSSLDVLEKTWSATVQFQMTHSSGGTATVTFAALPFYMTAIQPEMRPMWLQKWLTLVPLVAYLQADKEKNQY